MNLFLLNLVLALLWCVLNTAFGLADFVVGLLFGTLVIGLGQRGLGHRPGYLHALVTLLRFLWFAVNEIVLANIALAKVLLRRRMNLNPAIVAIALERQGPLPVTTLANLITLTPGTITLDVAPDCDEIYVHNLVLGDKDEFIASIKHYERRVIEVFRELDDQQ